MPAFVLLLLQRALCSARRRAAVHDDRLRAGVYDHHPVPPSTPLTLFLR